MIVRLQDSFRDICERNFSIGEEELRDVVFNPAGKNIVKSGTVSRIYFFGQAAKSYHLLVEGQWVAPHLNVIAAFKVFDDILAGLKDHEPLTVLRVLAERFGVPVKIGKFEDTFIIAKSFELKDREDRLLQISTQKGRHFAQTMHSSFRHEGGSTFLDVSLAYCLDVDKMAEYVKRQL